MSNFEQRLTKLETKVNEHSRQLEKQEDKNDTLTRLVTLVEMQTEVNRDQTEQMKKFDITLNKVNTNLNGLNRNLETIDKRVEQLEANDNERKLDLGKLLKDVLYKVVPSIILAWLIFHFGLK